MEKTLKRDMEQNKMLQMVLDSFKDPVYIIDAHDYGIILANRAAREKGLEEARTCYSLTHRIDKPCWQNNEQCPLKMVLEKKESVVVEHTHYDKEGRASIYEIRGYPLFDDNGEAQYMIEYSVEITDRKEKEKALAKALEDLTLFKDMTIERENKMIELKKEVNKVYRDAGKSEPFDTSFLDE